MKVMLIEVSSGDVANQPVFVEPLDGSDTVLAINAPHDFTETEIGTVLFQGEELDWNSEFDVPFSAISATVYRG